MSIIESYRGLSRLLDYPNDREGLLASYGSLASHLEQEGLPSPALPFASFVQGSTLAELQEDYVANFDFNPAAAPYLAHHLYGDNQKKGAFLIRVKQEFGRHDFTPEGCELPDHLAVLLSFLAHLAKRGETVQIEGLRVQVLRADSRRVHTLLVDPQRAIALDE